MALNGPFIVTFLVLWNVGCALAFLLGAPSTPTGQVVGGAVSLLASAVAMAIVLSGAFRKLVTHPVRRQHYRPGVFVFIAMVAAIIGFGWLGTGLGWG